MTITDDSALFAEFDQVSQEEWIEAIKTSLRGQALDSLTRQTYEGIALSPVATAEDLAGIPACDSLPGQFPFLRGTRAAGYRERPWLIAQELDIPDPQAFNHALQDALANGQTAVVLGSSPRIETIADAQAALADIDLSQTPLFLADGARALTIYGLLRAAVPAGKLARLSGCIGYDPLQELARRGSAPSDIFERMVEHVKEACARSPQLGCIAVGAAVYHDAGANAVQELAIALSAGVVYLREMTARSLGIAQAAGKMHFFLSIGENFFMEIAKLRAIKMLWAQVARAFGGNVEAQKINLHARGGSRNKSQLDAHSNILRATSEALAAASAGVDSITVPPFDAPRADSDAFSRRIARNLQLILQQELQLTRLIDPAGGSWHVERLTDQLARAAWKQFQEIEARGGLLACLQSGYVQREIQAVARQRRRDMQTRDAILVGVNMYVDPNETPPSHPRQAHPNDDVDFGEGKRIIAPALKPLRLAEAFEETGGESGKDT